MNSISLQFIEYRDDAAELGREVPWHVSAFSPTYQLTNRPRTPAATLRRAVEIGRAAGLRHVYEGNLPGEGETTSCPACGRPAISRLGFAVTANRIAGGRCPACGAEIAGVWS